MYGKLKLINDEWWVCSPYFNLKVYKDDINLNLKVDDVVDFIVYEIWEETGVSKWAKFKSQVNYTKNLTWEDIRSEYGDDQFAPFGGPFTNAMDPWEWLQQNYYPPNKKQWI